MIFETLQNPYRETTKKKWIHKMKNRNRRYWIMQNPIPINSIFLFTFFLIQLNVQLFESNHVWMVWNSRGDFDIVDRGVCGMVLPKHCIERSTLNKKIIKFEKKLQKKIFNEKIVFLPEILYLHSRNMDRRIFCVLFRIPAEHLCWKLNSGLFLYHFSTVCLVLNIFRMYGWTVSFLFG